MIFINPLAGSLSLCSSTCLLDMRSQTCGLFKLDFCKAILDQSIQMHLASSSYGWPRTNIGKVPHGCELSSI